MATYRQRPSYQSILSFVAVCGLLMGSSIALAIEDAKPTTVALTTTVPSQGSEAERTMMANLLALTEVALSQQPGITVVERMELDAALHELVLNRAQGSEAQSLQLGKLAAAELIVTAKLLEPTEDQKRYVLVRVTQSLSGKILGGAVALVGELTVDQSAQEVASYIAAVGTHPQTASITIAVAPFDSSGQFDRLRPLERSLRDIVVSRLIQYQQFRVLQRSEMRDLITEIDLARSGLSDAARMLELLPTRRAAYLLTGTIDERHSDNERRLIVEATVLNASTKAVVESIEFETPPDELTKRLGHQLHRLVEVIVEDAGRGNGSLAAAPKFDEVEHLFRLAVEDLCRFWRRKPRDFSHRDFRLPGIEPKSDGYSRVPLDSTLGKAMLRKAVDRLESVLYLQPERRDAELALAFCLICHMDDLWQPERADRLLRNVFHRDPTDQIAAAALDWLAEMYYHHESGDLKPEDVDAARKQVLFAFENMPAANRDYEWSRLIQLLLGNDRRNRDDHATASVMRLAAEFMANVEPSAQRNLASHVTNIAQQLCAAPHGNPNRQAEAQKLLDDWSTSDHKWKRHHALQALAGIAHREKNLTKAVELYRAAGEVMKGEQSDHVHHSNLLQAARLLRQSGDADEALALLQSFEPRDRRPSSLLNGRYGEELGTTLESLGRKEEALETYVSYAEASAHLADNSNVEERIKALGGVPLREDRDIDVRYIDGPDNNPLYCRTLATDGKILYVGGFPRGLRGRGVSALNLATNKWIRTIGGPEVRAVCLAYDAGYLWVGTEEQGLWRCTMATGTWKNWKLEVGLPDNKIVDLAAQQDTAFVSVGDRNAGGVLSIDAENRIRVYEDEGAPSVALFDLTLHNGRLYGINRRLFELDLSTGAWQDSLPPEASRHFGLYGLFRAGSELWGSSYGREIFRIGASPEENARYQQAWFPAASNNIKAGYGVEFALQRNGQLWFGGNPWARFKSCGFYRLDLQTGEFVIYGPRDGFRLSDTYECYDGVEAADRLWIATSAGLAEVKERKSKILPAAASTPEPVAAREASPIDRLDEQGFSQLHRAASGGHAARARQLLQAGASADVRQGTYYGTPLQYAAARGHAETVEALIEHGATVDSQDANERTPLIWAAMEGHFEVIRRLLDAGADVNATNAGGWTPLHYAVSHGHAEAAQLLIDRGANIYAENSKNQTPAELNPSLNLKLPPQKQRSTTSNEAESAPRQPVASAAAAPAETTPAEPVADYSKPIPRGVPAGAEIHLAADQPVFLLGENILLHYEVKNSGNEPIVVEWGGDNRGSPRHTRVRVIATDAAGRVIEDPTPDPPNFGGMGGRLSIKPGKSFFHSVPLMRYCLFDKPGKYSIRVAHDLGWGEGERGNIADDDERWTTTQIELVMPSPDEAEQIVQKMLRLPDQSGSIGEKQKPYGDFTCLRYSVYLPPLQRLADNGDLRAFAGLAMIPTVEATRAIVVCLASEDADVVDAAVAALRGRLPHPSLTDLTARQPWWSDGQRRRQLEMANQTWRDEFAEPIMVYARKALAATPGDGMRDNRMEAAAWLVESVAPPAEMSTVIKALDRMLQRTQEVELETPLIYGIIPHLQWAAAGILSRGGNVPHKPESPGEIAVYLESLNRGAHGKRQSVKEDKEHNPALPQEFEGYARQWMDHPIDYVQRITIENLPTPCPAWAIEPLRTRLIARDLGVQYAAINAVRGSGDMSFGPALLTLVRQADDQWVVDGASNAAFDVGVPRDEVLLAWADRLDRADFDNNYRTMNQLAALIEHQGSGGNSNGPEPTGAERAALKRRWIALIERQREAIRARKVFKVSDPEITRDLIPPYFNIGVEGKTWPPP